MIFKSLICGYELPQAKSKCHTHLPDSYNQHNQACICKYWVPHTPYFCHMFVYILLKGNQESKERNKQNESGISAQLCLTKHNKSDHTESIRSLPVTGEPETHQKNIFKCIHATKSLQATPILIMKIRKFDTLRISLITQGTFKL